MADLIKTYMEMAALIAENSKAIRKKVGAVLVTPNGTILASYNGTPTGTDNTCEHRVWEANETSFGDMGEWKLTTKSEVIHAEMNCLCKCAREGVSCVDAILHVTLSPCMACSAMIKQSGIKKVYYRETYRDKTGVDYLNNNGVECVQF